MIKTVDALQLLRPHAEWVLRGEELEWLDANQTQPSASEITAEIQRLQTEYDNNDYQRQRAMTYWPLADQLDAMYWDRKNGTNIWEQHIEAVKNKFPKP